jgi:hypothetical protein
MAYAKISFSGANITAYQALQDIKGIITGAITDTSGLVYADKNSSEIKIGAFPGAGNWQVVVDSLGAGVLVLASPCVDASKTKYAIFETYTAVSSVRQSPYNIKETRLFLSTAHSINGTSFTNQTFTNYCGTNATVADGLIMNANYPLNLNPLASPIYMHWGPNHVMIYKATAPNYIMRGVFEFPETTLTTSKNLVPVLSVFTNSFGGTYWASSQGKFNSTTLGGTVIQHPNLYRVSTQTQDGPFGLGTSGNMWVDNSLFNRSISRTVNSTGQVAYPLIPMYTASYNVGFPAAFMSTYSGVYLTASGAASIGDTLTYGTDTYIYLPMNSSAGNTSLAVIWG